MFITDRKKVKSLENLKDEIFRIESKIMKLEQDVFYINEELESLKFDLQNMKKIQEGVNKK